MTPRRVSEAELHAFVDGELSPQERAEVETLLQASPADQATMRELADLNEALRARYAEGLDAPLPQPVRRLLARIPRRQSGFAARQRAIAAGLLIALVAGMAGYIVRDVRVEGRQEQAFVINAIGAHSVYVPEVRHPVEVKAAEEHLVRWLNRRVGAPFAAPSLVEHGWKMWAAAGCPTAACPRAFCTRTAVGRASPSTSQDTGFTHLPPRPRAGGIRAF